MLVSIMNILLIIEVKILIFLEWLSYFELTIQFLLTHVFFSVFILEATPNNIPLNIYYVLDYI